MFPLAVYPPSHPSVHVLPSTDDDGQLPGFIGAEGVGCEHREGSYWQNPVAALNDP